MQAGKLDRLVTLQRLTQSVGDAGDVTHAWTTIAARRRASYRQSTGSFEKVAPSSIVSAQDFAEFRIRYSDDVADLRPQDRVVYPAMEADSPESTPDNWRIYDIVAVGELGRREGLRILAVRRIDATT